MTRMADLVDAITRCYFAETLSLQELLFWKMSNCTSVQHHDNTSPNFLSTERSQSFQPNIIKQKTMHVIKTRRGVRTQMGLVRYNTPFHLWHSGSSPAFQSTAAHQASLSSARWWPTYDFTSPPLFQYHSTNLSLQQLCRPIHLGCCCCCVRVLLHFTIFLPPPFAIGTSLLPRSGSSL
jgi:hypothetical protein